MKHRPLVGVLLFLIYLAMICIAHCSCSPQKRIERRVSKAVAYLKAQHRLADTCAANFPIHDSVHTQTDTVVTVRDTVVHDTTLYCDSQTNGRPSVRYRLVVPPCHDTTIYVTREHYQRDPAEITSLYQKLQEKEAEITALKKQTETLTISNHLIKRAKLGWMIAALLLGAGIIAYVAFKLR